MPDGLLARSRRSALPVLLAATLPLAGCAGAGSTSSGSGSGVLATGHTLTLVISAPSGAAADPVDQDVLAAERLAFAQKSGEVSAFRLSLTQLGGSRISDNARTAIQDTSAIAYIGELTPGASADSLGITNAQQLLQVSPTDTAAAFTQTTPAISAAPSKYYEALKNYGRTFARVIPTTTPEAMVDAAQLRSLRVRGVYLAEDGSDYGLALAAALKNALSGVTVTEGPPSQARFATSGADALFFAGQSPTAGANLFAAVAGAHPGVKLVGPSVLADPRVLPALGAGKLSVYISTPGFLPRRLPPAARGFVSAFRRAYHRLPLPQAIFGYEAVAAVIDVLKQAGNAANDRAAVVRGFFDLRNRASVLGTYSINSNGDTSLAPFVIERLRGGRLVPVGAPSG